MGNVISLHAERWVEGVFEHGTLRVDVSTKGRVRFNIMVDDNGEVDEILDMQQMANLGEALSVAYKEDDDG